MNLKYNFVQLYVHFSLSCLGVIKNLKYRITYLVIYFGAAISVLTGTIIGLLASREASRRIEILPGLMLQVTVILMFVASLGRTGRIVGLLKRLKEGRHVDYVLDRANTIMKNNTVWYFIIVIVLFFLVFVPVAVYYAHPASKISEKNSLVIPYWFSCGNVDGRKTNDTRYLICLPGWTRSQLIFSNILLIPAVEVLTWGACSLLVLYSVTVNELLIHTEIFASMIFSMNTTMENFHQHQKWTHNKISRYQQKVHDELIEIIRYQQFIRSCALETIRTWKSLNMVVLCNFSIAIALMVLFVVKEKDDELFMALRMACLAIMCFISFILICLCGHAIFDLNEILFNELCTIPWYQKNTSIQFRKLYVTMLAQNLKSIDMKVFGVYNINLPMIFTVLKSAYSLLNGFQLLSK